MNSFDIILRAQSLAAVGASGLETDAEFAAWEADLDALGEDGASKTLARRYVGTSLRDQAARLKALAAEIADRAKRLETQADRVDELTLSLVREVQSATGADRLALADGSTVKAEIRRSRAVVITAEMEIPDEYLRHRWEPDKPAIKAALESGQSVPGATLELRESLGLRWGK